MIKINIKNQNNKYLKIKGVQGGNMWLLMFGCIIQCKVPPHHMPLCMYLVPPPLFFTCYQLV
jgi:hypothetical protein